MIFNRLRIALRALVGANAASVNTSPLATVFNSGGPLPNSLGLSSLYGAGAAMQVSALSACVRLISGNVAKLPFQVFRLSGDDRVRERDHPVSILLNQKPNGWQTAHEFRRQMTAQVALYGNAVALKRMVGARIAELIPWEMDRVTIRREDDYSAPIYELRDSAGKTRVYRAADVLHLRDLTLDGVVGLSRIQQARQGLILAVAAETYATSYLMNGAEAGVVLKTDKVLNADQRHALREGWIQGHQGPSRAHAPAVLEGGLDIKSTGATNKDSQLLELRSFQVEDIARIYGVPPHLIGLTEKQTSWGTGVEQMAIGFLQFNLLDWLVMWESAARRDLFDDEVDADVFAEHLVEGLLRADFKTRMDAYAIAVTNGILSRNEVRQKENLPAYEGGDDYLYPSNMTVNGEAPEPVDQLSDGPTEFPADRPEVAWRKSLRTALRAVRNRESAYE